MFKTVLCSIVARGTKVKVIALCTLPPNSRDVISATRVTCDMGVAIAWKKMGGGGVGGGGEVESS